MRPVILDLDMGVDDALAIILALNSSELDVMGVSVVAGNVPLEVGTQSALQVLELMGRSEIPVYGGAEKPLKRDLVSAQEVHGPEGLGEARLPEPEMLPAGDAVEFLIESILARPGEVMLVAAGPLTNLALAEARRPGILHRARRVFVMGGCLQIRGNVTPVAEYNFFVDPHAARQVLRSGANVTLMPLDVTQQVGLDAEIIRKATEGSSDPVARFIGDAARTVIAYNEAQWGYSGLFLHDPLAVALAFDPLVCELQSLGLDVETADEETVGKVTVDPSEGDQVECAVSVDSGRFLRLFLHRCLGMD